MPKTPKSHAPPSHTKVTRQEWVDMALATLAEEPIDQLRVLGLAGRLSVSRSSFYWYFKNLDELHSELLAIWERNTESIVERSNRTSDTVVSACLGIFECWADTRLYHDRLDLAVRDWGRREPEIAKRVAESDEARQGAITEMFSRFGFDPNEAVVRARLLYHSQVGYYALGTDEPMQDRLAYLPHYLEAMTGAAPTEAELASFQAFLDTVEVNR